MTEEEITNMSDEDLNKFLMTSAITASKERKQAAAQPVTPPVDTTQGMSGFQLGMAGAGKVFDDMLTGLEEIGVGQFGSATDIKKYNQRKAEKQKVDKQLMSNYPAKVGNFGAEAAIAVATPARVGAQALVEGVRGATAPTINDIKGLELPTRAMGGLERAAVTGAIGVPMHVVGKKVGALTGQFTPENAAMLEAGRAARRVGIRPTVGAMTPGAGSKGIEAGSSWYPEHVAEQTNIFNRVAGQEVPVATSILGETATRNVPGEALRRSIAQAGDQMRNQGARMWGDLDNYITTNNLPAIVARDTQATVRNIANTYSPPTVRGQPNIRNNEVFQYIDRVDDANNAVTNRIRGMVNGRNQAAPTFTELHEMQSTVGKALARARRDASAPNSPRSADDAVRELGTLYRSISNDVDNWATTNPTAGKMFQQAKGYWRDTVVPSVINNDLYQKASRGSLGSHNRGYDEPRQFFSDIINKPEEAKALYATMDQRGRDLITSLHLLPDVGTALTSPRLQGVRSSNPQTGALMDTGIRAPESASGGLTTTARTLAGVRPALWQGVLGHLPLSRQLGTSEPYQRFRLANNAFNNTVPGRVAWAGMQGQQEDLNTIIDSVVKGKR